MHNSEDEIWAPISEYEGRYEVSNLGNVRALIDKHCRTLLVPRSVKKYMDRYGYEYVSLSKEAIGKKMKVHRLVAISFIPNPLLLPQVNHEDGDKKNNIVSNLSWCTNSQNHQHAHRVGLKTMNHLIEISRTNKMEKNPRAKTVYQFSLDGEFIKKWDCMLKAANSIGRTSSGIKDACSGRQRTSGGFKWAYTNNLI